MNLCLSVRINALVVLGQEETALRECEEEIGLLIFHRQDIPSFCKTTVHAEFDGHAGGLPHAIASIRAQH